MSIAQHFDAVGIRHLDVGDDHVIERAVEFLLGTFSGVHGFDLVALAAQGNIQHFADGALVVTNQNVTHALVLRSAAAAATVGLGQELWFRNRRLRG